MKTFRIAATVLLGFSLLLTACDMGSAPSTATAVPFATSTEETTIGSETGTPEMSETETPAVSETETPAVSESETPDMNKTPAATRAPMSSVSINVGQDATLGSYLVDDQGFTLYLFTKDTMNTSTCTGDCAEEWPPLLITSASAATVGTGLDATKLGTTVRADGGIQVTYNGWPLYYFDEDEQPGDVNGQGEDEFFVVSPVGEKVSK